MTGSGSTTWLAVPGFLFPLPTILRTTPSGRRTGNGSRIDRFRLVSLRPSGCTHRMAQAKSGRSARRAANMVTPTAWSPDGRYLLVDSWPAWARGIPNTLQAMARLGRLQAGVDDRRCPRRTAVSRWTLARLLRGKRRPTATSRPFPIRVPAWQLPPAHPIRAGVRMDKESVLRRARSQSHRRPGAIDGPRFQGDLFPSAISAVAAGQRRVLRCYGGRPAVSGQCADPSGAIRAVDGDHGLASTIEGGVRAW